jgi:hypothetical protein
MPSTVLRVAVLMLVADIVIAAVMMVIVPRPRIVVGVVVVIAACSLPMIRAQRSARPVVDNIDDDSNPLST